MKLHSIVDQITNSSGTTYIFSDDECIKNAQEILKTIMGILKVEGNIEDYFDISLVTTDMYNEIAADCKEYGDEEPKKDVVDYKIKITPKENPDLDIAPLMDGLFKGFNTYQEGMFFCGESIDWYNDKNLKGLS